MGCWDGMLAMVMVVEAAMVITVESGPGTQ